MNPFVSDLATHQDGGKARGFTLIELMIVVAVIGILSAIAYPSYVDYVRKSHRGQAKADLVEYGQLAERFHTVNNTYVGFQPPFGQSPGQGTARYTVAMNPAPTQSTFTIVATPATSDQLKDKCGTLSIDQAGRKTNSTGALADCW